MSSYKNTVPQDMECSLDGFFSQAGREINSQIVFALEALTKLLYLVNYPEKMQKEKKQPTKQTKPQTEKRLFIYLFIFKN